MRPTRAQTLMQTAFLWAERSTCSRLHVGCVIHRDGRILVQGYNGAPAGLDHCTHRVWDGTGPIPEWAKQTIQGMKDGVFSVEWETLPEITPQLPLWRDNRSMGFGPPPGCTRAVHAEQNAISFAARWGVGLEGAWASITHQPCVSCAQCLINAGITHVIFAHDYRLRDGLDLLMEANIGISRFSVDTGETRAIG